MDKNSIEMKLGILSVLQILLLWVHKCLSVCNTAVFYGDELASYGFGQSHPFNSNRIYSFWSKVVHKIHNKILSGNWIGTVYLQEHH